MFIDQTTSREDLELAILSENDLYASIDEAKFLNEEYTTEELRDFIAAWVEAGDETAF